MILYFFMSLFLLLTAFYIKQAWLVFVAVGFLVWSLLAVVGVPILIAEIIGAICFIGGIILQYNSQVRRSLITDRLFAIAAKVLPRMSDTEKTALEAGTVWFDGDIFSGNPDWKKFERAPKFQLSKDEQAFIDGPVEKLCTMLDDWQIQQDRDLSPEIWAFLKKQKFFGLVIPKNYGGLGFSASGHSAVVTKIATRSITAAVTVMVPNSLGPGELLLTLRNR